MDFSILVWPGVVLVIALVFLFWFSSDIRALLGRTKRLGTGGIETYEPQQPVAPSLEEKKALDDFMRELDSPFMREIEAHIVRDLEARNLVAPDDRERALIRSLAMSMSNLVFMSVYEIIWGSQITFLRAVNARGVLPVAKAEAMTYYEAAKASLPGWYANYAFDDWFGYLVEEKLVTPRGTGHVISIKGREFLQWMAAVGKAEKRWG